MTSSDGHVCGPYPQSNYAASNAVLDNLARQRHPHGPASGHNLAGANQRRGRAEPQARVRREPAAIGPH